MTLNARTTLTAGLIAALVATPALATTTPPRATFQGTSVGTFDAAGRGNVVLRGQLTAFGQIRGRLEVRDAVGGAVVKLNGVTQKPRLVRVGTTVVRVYLFRNVNRKFYVRGRSVRIALATTGSNALSVSAYGRGRVLELAGTGSYTLNAGEQGEWSNAGPPLAIRPSKR